MLQRAAPARLGSSRAMRRLALSALIIVAVIAVGSQFALPPIAEDRAADRLTDAGGSADVSISAFPALRLLFGDGDRIDVRGRGLTLPATGDQTGALDDLNGFTRVDIDRMRGAGVLA